MAKEEYISTNEQKVILQEMLNNLSATVWVSIKRKGDSYTWDFTQNTFTAPQTSGQMAGEAAPVGNLIYWTASFTPSSNDIYIVTIYDETNDENYTIYYIAVNNPITTAPPSSEAASGLTTLEIMNGVCTNLGLPTLGSLSSLDTHYQKIFDTINECSINIATHTFWLPLRTKGLITLQENIFLYDVPGALVFVDEYSFKYDKRKKLSYLKAREFDNLTLDETLIGEPKCIFREGDFFQIYKVPGAQEANKQIPYRYYQMPSLLTVSNPSAKSWFPAGFERKVLINYATYKMMAFDGGDPQTSIYYADVFGGRIAGVDVLGGLYEMKSLYEDTVIQVEMADDTFL